jgi:hypothetical protein
MVAYRLDSGCLDVIFDKANTFPRFGIPRPSLVSTLFPHDMSLVIVLRQG